MQRKSEEDIRRLAYFDSLTGLPNGDSSSSIWSGSCITPRK
jgi:GGDEF domain-containing protein